MFTKGFGEHWIGSTRLCAPVAANPVTGYVRTARKKSSISKENGVPSAVSR